MFLSVLRPVAKRKPAILQNESQLFSVLSAEDLLSGQEIRKLLTEIRAQTLLPPPYYNELYHNLIINFAEFVQILPGSQGQLGGTLLESLKYAHLVLQVYHENAVQEVDPLLAYAAFSAALLFNVPRIFSKTIVICNEHGVFVDTWAPLTTSLLEVGSHYKVRHYGINNLSLHPKLRVLLALKLMPKAGLEWLAEDEDVFGQWLSVLSADEEESDGLTAMLSKARMLPALDEPVAEYLPKALKITQPPDMAAGEAFWEWLRNELMAQELDDQSLQALGLRISEEGLVIISEAIFQQFSQLHPHYRDWRSVAAQFKKLGLGVEPEEQEAVIEEEEVFSLFVKPAKRKKQTLLAKKAKEQAKQSQNFFNQKEANAVRQARAGNNLRDCLVVAEKQLLRQLFRKSTYCKQLQEQSQKKTARRRLLRLMSLLRARARAKKRRLAMIRVGRNIG